MLKFRNKPSTLHTSPMTSGHLKSPGSEWYVEKAFQIFCPWYTSKSERFTGELQIVRLVYISINLLCDRFFHAVLSDVQRSLKSLCLQHFV